MIPVRSLRRLIQEDHYPDEFRCLVCCILLNRCRGVTVRRVLDSLFEAYPDAAAMADADHATLAALLHPLGFQRQRASRLKAFSKGYLGGFHDVAELHGIGDYASDFWRMFFLERLGDVPPDDGPLTEYWGIAKGGLWPTVGWDLDPAVERRRLLFDASQKPKA